MRFGELGSSDLSEKKVLGDSSGGMTLSSGLTIKTRYRVQVAAETSAGIGVYSFPQTFETPDSE